MNSHNVPISQFIAAHGLVEQRDYFEKFAELRNQLSTANIMKKLSESDLSFANLVKVQFWLERCLDENQQVFDIIFDIENQPFLKYGKMLIECSHNQQKRASTNYFPISAVKSDYNKKLYKYELFPIEDLVLDFDYRINPIDCSLQRSYFKIFEQIRIGFFLQPYSEPQAINQPNQIIQSSQPIIENEQNQKQQQIIGLLIESTQKQTSLHPTFRSFVGNIDIEGQIGMVLGNQMEFRIEVFEMPFYDDRQFDQNLVTKDNRALTGKYKKNLRNYNLALNYCNGFYSNANWIYITHRRCSKYKAYQEHSKTFLMDLEPVYSEDGRFNSLNFTKSNFFKGEKGFYHEKFAFSMLVDKLTQKSRTNIFFHTENDLLMNTDLDSEQAIYFILDPKITQEQADNILNELAMNQNRQMREEARQREQFQQDTKALQLQASLKSVKTEKKPKKARRILSQEMQNKTTAFDRERRAKNTCKWLLDLLPDYI